VNKGNKKYIIVLGFCFISLITLQLLAPKPIKWNLSYSKKDKIPFGASALYEMLPTIFPGQQLLDKSTPLYNSLNNINYDHKNYIIINQKFDIDKLDLRELFNFVKNGNNVFIAANNFGKGFADTLKIQTDDFFESSGKNIIQDSLLYNAPVQINFTNPSLKSKADYSLSKGCENTFLTSFDTTKAIVLGINSNKQANFIDIPEGKGHFYISTTPEAFCNYHFVNMNTNSYACKALSYLPNQAVMWDEYYKVGNISHESPLRVIFNNPALLAAYYLLIFSLLIFMLIGIKRRQRIIPVIEPLSNTTLQFVNIVGTLYYQSGNHKNIAEKKINYFLEYIRSAFYLKTTVYDSEFIEKISNLSGIEKEKINSIFKTITDLKLKNKITQNELLKLHKQIEEFYTLNKR
jgi:hypothetical protein